MRPYDPKTIEEKWQKKWKEEKLFQGTASKSPKDKFYSLYAFAYPSAAGLHVGHVEPLTAIDILSRFQRMNGRDVFFPVGWDAFGLPAENYAIKTGVPPAKTTKEAIKTFEEQVGRLGISYDWETEIATCDSEYYRWTQWLFIELFKAGLAYRDKGYVNWCPQDRTVLANEQVVAGKCERCGTSVVQKELTQWKFRITKYQDELIDGLKELDWPKSTKDQQVNWIGRSVGASAKFKVQSSNLSLECFTTRLDTIFGVTFLVISPEKLRELELDKLIPEDRRNTVETYLEAAFHKTEEERRQGEKEKTGADTGIKVVHPLTGAEIPVWVADYVLAGYGTGIVMGVPAHDERDGSFAAKFGLQVVPVIDENGRLVRSGEYSGLEQSEAVKRLIAEHKDVFAKSTTYKLRDWLISRQRYWGAPIPMLYCEKCAREGRGTRPEMPGWYPDEKLPVLLPDVPDFKPTDDGMSPIEKASDAWKYAKCPGCGEKAKREVDTMDTFVDSSWYFLRFTDARNDKEFAGKDRLKQWMPVDFYIIGAEHTVLHLLYSRFFTKFLRDSGYLSFGEPFLKLRHQGMILGPDGKKMSKSKGNVINPDDVISKFGADTLRVYEMFMGPLDADKPWDTAAVAGVYRFLSRLQALAEKNLEMDETDLNLMRTLHKTIKKVGEDIAAYRFNTAIASLMEFTNAWTASQNSGKGLGKEELFGLIKILAPFAPHLAEELWYELGKSESAHLSRWPKYDPKLIQDDQIEIAVQVNARVRGRFMISAEGAKDKEAMKRMALMVLSDLKIDAGKEPKVIVVPDRLVNVISEHGQ